jgi:hypothetical protein
MLSRCPNCHEHTRVCICTWEQIARAWQRVRDLRKLKQKQGARR